MKRIVPLLLVFAALPAFGHLEVNPSHAVIVPGQTIQVTVALVGFGTYTPVEATFTTSGPIAIDRVEDGSAGSKVVSLRALAIGDGVLIAHSPNADPNGIIATFNVVECTSSAVSVTITHAVVGFYHYLIASGQPIGGSSEWFYGRLGDTSHPYNSSGADSIYFTLPQGTASDNWVRYTAPCGVATAFVSVGPPRKRAVRH
jgi:hypothetical protein